MLRERSVPTLSIKGGFLSYCHKLADGADIRYGMKLVQVDLGNQVLRFANGAEVNYRRLVSTIPLPYLSRSQPMPRRRARSAALLRSSQFYRVDVAVNHPRRRDEICATFTTKTN